ncbi:hypothetical protein EGW08_012470 [Elysia chlorotica]|uniref:Uncharacterized protein n=1 Tax=Elysia chlorotica TaxID=188477 RepID=A0A3S1HHY8_ELYCH|nr:hypothetical protein EGW08_012470 [Elysia chlorotica]
MDDHSSDEEDENILTYIYGVCENLYSTICFCFRENKETDHGEDDMYGSSALQINPNMQSSNAPGIQPVVVKDQSPVINRVPTVESLAQLNLGAMDRRRFP